MNKPKVLMIGPGRKVRGGISTVVENYYRCDLDKAIDLTYLATMEDGNKAKKLFAAGRAYLSFGRLVKDCDIVHIHMAAQASFDRKALFVARAKKAGKKIVIHQHGGDFDKYFFEQVDEAKRKRIKKIFSFADKIIVLSEEWADFFGKNVCSPKKVEVLYNGVVMPAYVKEDYSDHNVLLLGRLGEPKGTYDLLKAIPRVIEAVPDATFYFAGDGDVEKCKKITTEIGLEKYVVFLGWIRDKDKEKHLRSCSTFILPSYHEGMPMSVLEAMSYGLATISTNVGGIPQIIDTGVDGIRVAAGDVAAIERALVDVLTNVSERKRLGNAGRLKIEKKFDLRSNVKRLEEIYREI